jgi:hypothetical protein
MIVRESLASFTREAPSVSGMGLGKAAIFPQIMDEIIYDVLLNSKTGPPLNKPQKISEFVEGKMYMIDTRKLLVFYEENKDNKVIVEILNEMLDKVLTFNPNKLEHHAAGWVNLFFRLGREEEIWANPKWITDYTFNEFRQLDLERTIKETKKLGANKAFILGFSRGERELELWGIKNGATNVNTKNNEPIQRACERGDTEIVKLLLADPKVDPACNTSDGKRYSSDETNFCIRRAAKAGHIEVVKLLLKDKRVNPASRSNWALAAALEKGDFEMCKLLLTDQRVRDAIFDMKPVALKRFENYRRTGQI